MKHQNYRAFTHNEAKSIVGRLAVGVDDKAVCLVVSYGPNKHTASKKQDEALPWEFVIDDECFTPEQALTHFHLQEKTNSNAMKAQSTPFGVLKTEEDDGQEESRNSSKKTNTGNRKTGNTQGSTHMVVQTSTRQKTRRRPKKSIGNQKQHAST